MNFWFTLKEGLKGFSRARLATTITITSVAFALLLIGLFMIFSLNMNHWIGGIRSKIELEVFLKPYLDNNEGLKIKQRIELLEGVGSINYISKDKAAERFQKEFGKSVYDVLDSNPLPPSCTVRIKKGFQTSTSIKKISASIGKIKGVDEVVYKKELLSVIDRYIKFVFLIAGGAGLILVIIAVILLYNTIRLTIFARRDIIEIMKLVGAKESFIRRPFLVEGFMQGLFGALLANGMLFLTINIVRKLIYPYLACKIEIYAAIVLFGLIIGLVSSSLSVSKYLQRI